MRESIVLVPGIDGTGVSFHRQVPLLERRYAVTRTRLREDDRHRMSDLIDDLRGVVDESNGPVTLIGESFGGALALSFALDHPERVRRLLIVNSFAHFDSQARLRLAYHLTRAMPWGLMPLARRLATSRMHSPHTERDVIQEYQELMRASKKGGIVARLRILRDYDLRSRLGALQTPVLFLAADLDNLVPSVEQATLMQKLAPRASMKVLTGHGHTCLLAPDIDLTSILDEWITTS
jgi:pimeloyl-ACP methyl ester carboxylesterase